MQSITQAMEAVSLPAEMEPPTAPREPIDPTTQTVRPWDRLGSPSDPVPFPPARYYYGKRADVLCYRQDTGTEEVVRNVLLRDYSRTHPSNGRDDADERITEAYWRVPEKPLIKTIMGHVEICIVLERCTSEKCKGQRKTNAATGAMSAFSTPADDDSQDESSSLDDDEEEECDDIVFQWTDRRVAVKVNYWDRMERLRNRHAEDPLKEISAMQLIGDQHPHVLGCQQVLFDGTNLNVVMRFCDAGDLFQLLQESQGTSDRPGLPEAQARYWFRQLMSGVHHLHEVGVCHRDLSPENVMIDTQSGALIIDMGMCLRVPYTLRNADGTPSTDGVIVDRQQLAITPGRQGPIQRCLFRPQGACGKLPYMSPEIYRNREPFDGNAADVWTAGTILFCMVTGNRSYQRPHPSDAQFYWMSQGLPQLLSDWGIRLSPVGLHLLQNMLQVNPRLRLTIEEVLRHPWFLLPDEIPHRMMEH